MILHADKICAGLEIDMGCYPTLHLLLRNLLVQDFLHGQDDNDFVAVLEERLEQHGGNVNSCRENQMPACEFHSQLFRFALISPRVGTEK